MTTIEGLVPNYSKISKLNEGRDVSELVTALKGHSINSFNCINPHNNLALIPDNLLDYLDHLTVIEEILIRKPLEELIEYRHLLRAMLKTYVDAKASPQMIKETEGEIRLIAIYVARAKRLKKEGDINPRGT